MIGTLLLVPSLAACSTTTVHEEVPPSSLVGGHTPWVGTFDSVDLPLPVSSLTALACPTTSDCWATGTTVGGGTVPNGAAVVASRNAGASWTAEPIPGSAGYLSTVSCRDTRHCVVGGQTGPGSPTQGLVLATDNGGRTWTETPPVPGTTDVTAVTCLPSGNCLGAASGASGAVAVASAAPDAPWQVVGPLPAGTVGATGISCTDDEHCWVTGQVAVDVDHSAGSVDVTSDGGAQWTALPLPAGTGLLGGISCRSAAGPSSGSLPYGASTTDAAAGSTTSTAAPAPSPTTTLATTTTTTGPGVPGIGCTAVGTTSTALGAVRTGKGIVLTTGDGGSTWTSEPVPPAASSFAALSCPVGGSCVVVGATAGTGPSSGVVVLSGKGADPWRHPAVLTVPQPLAAVSCAALGHCVMGGEAVGEQLAPS